MNLNILIGIVLIASGIFYSGSIMVPFRKIKEWSWENIKHVLNGMKLMFQRLDGMLFIYSIITANIGIGLSTSLGILKYKPVSYSLKKERIYSYPCYTISLFNKLPFTNHFVKIYIMDNLNSKLY